MNFQILKFIFFFGWLEVAEAIENPFGRFSNPKKKVFTHILSLGNDADDFHICQLVSRHLWAIGKNLDLYDGPPPLEVHYFVSNHSKSFFLQDDDNNFDDTDYDSDAADSVKTSLTINIGKSD